MRGKRRKRRGWDEIADGEPLRPAFDPGVHPPARADRPTEVQKFHANIVAAFFGSCAIALLVVLIQFGFQRIDRAVSANQQRLTMLSNELSTFAGTFHKVIGLAHEGSLWKARYLSMPRGASAEDSTVWAKGERKMTWQDVYERMTSTLNALEAQSHPDVLCHRLQIYLANPESDRAVETLRKSVSHLMFFSEKEPGFDDLDLPRQEARLQEQMETVNRDWDNAIIALKSEFVHR